jgi:DNA-directed RNA polymerase subunit N (RpoN/RPB10)
MIIPVRCFSCNAVIGNKWERYKKLIKEKIEKGSENSEAEAMDDLGVKRFCCRRMLLSHTDFIDKLVMYEKS